MKAPPTEGIWEQRISRLDDTPPREGEAVVYWMQRSQRAWSNLALNLAIDLANAHDVPVLCLFILDPHYPWATDREYVFILQGLVDVAAGLKQRNVSFCVRQGPIGQTAAQFLTHLPASAVITDASHLKFGRKVRDGVASRLLAAHIPLWQVDNDLVVPVRVAGKQQVAARTMRFVVRKHLDQFLQPVPDPAARFGRAVEDVDLDFHHPDAAVRALPIDHTVPPALFEGGRTAARARLNRFVANSMERYHHRRNAPHLDATSRLSPYLHFGHIDPWTVAYAIREAGAPEEARSAFLDELLVRRELANNFTYYNQEYDSFTGSPQWAQETLRQHETDPRSALYTLQELAAAKTHDDLWNAGQVELLKTGTMHGWVRMYWGKQIITWTERPEDAFDFTVELNNRFALDGRDPVSYANISWCYGTHDHPWPSRPIFGSVRSMTRGGAERKFDIAAYINAVGQLPG